MNISTPILVATDTPSDAELVEKLLREEFDSVVTSTDPDKAATDFEKCKPAVLILAFDSLVKAESYYLGLYRMSRMVHSHPHRTLVLCGKDDLRRVYDLCKKEYFDDYILFWPMVHDAFRLPMSVRQALRQLSGGADGVPSSAEFAAQARHIASLESMLGKSIAQGGEHIAAASESIQQVERKIEAAMDQFSRNIMSGMGPDVVEIRNEAAFQQELKRLKSEQLLNPIQAARASMQPVQQWIGNVRQELAPQLESARSLATLTARVPRSVLVVEDDPLQQMLLRAMLSDESLDLAFASSGLEAIAMTGKRRPEVILMDINLPDIDGIEAVRRLKSVKEFAATPVIMITGHSDEDAVTRSLQAGAAEFVVKPFDKEIVLTKVRTILQSR